MDIRIVFSVSCVCMCCSVREVSLHVRLFVQVFCKSARSVFLAACVLAIYPRCHLQANTNVTSARRSISQRSLLNSHAYCIDSISLRHACRSKYFSSPAEKMCLTHILDQRPARKRDNAIFLAIMASRDGSQNSFSLFSHSEYGKIRSLFCGKEVVGGVSPPSSRSILAPMRSPPRA